MELEIGVDFLQIDVPIKFSMCSHHVHQVPNVILKMFPIALHCLGWTLTTYVGGWKGCIILILFWDYKLLFGESKKTFVMGQSKWLIATT
jgi:hypothetical protein